MAYLPGIPDFPQARPTVASPTIATPSAGHKGSTGIAKTAHNVGKPGRSESVGSPVGRPGKGISQITGGSQALHGMNHYGKTPPPGMGDMAGSNPIQPTSHAGMTQIRGGSGGIRRNARFGGIGPGKMGTMGDPVPAGSDTTSNYDTE